MNSAPLVKIKIHLFAPSKNRASAHLNSDLFGSKHTIKLVLISMTSSTKFESTRTFITPFKKFPTTSYSQK